MLPVNPALQVVRDHHHYHVGFGRYFGHFRDAQAGGLRSGDAGAAGVKPDHHVLPVVLEVQGVGVALAAVTDDADSLFRDVGQVGVLIVVNVNHALSSSPNIRSKYPGLDVQGPGPVHAAWGAVGLLGLGHAGLVAAHHRHQARA